VEQVNWAEKPVIESVHFQNFKSLREVELTGLQRLTVIVGPNGAGKTSVLQGLHLLGRFLRHGRWDPFRFVTSGEERFVISVIAGRVHISWSTDSKRRPDVSTFEIVEGEQISRFETGGTTEPFRAHPVFRQVLRSSFLEFDVWNLGAPSEASPRPSVESNGAGLPTLLAYFAGAERDTLESIEVELREILGITGRIRTFPDEVEVEERENIRIDDQLVPRVTRRKAAAHRFEVEIDDVGSIPGDLLSEGTLVSLGLLAVLHQADCPSLILFDDIDKGLHPDAQAKLIASLRRLLARRPELQILCTSHSPYLLDHFQPEEVQVLSLTGGRVAAARLDQHQDWPKWKGKLQTGEFWQSVGESWITSKPKPETDEVPIDGG
jgi:predicted ATPase